MKKILNYIIAVTAVILCSLLTFSPIDLKVADYFQRPLKPLDESKQVIMIAIDNTAVERIGTWPFSRDVYAKVNTVLKDLGAESVVYDLTFTEKSGAKVDEQYVKETLPASIDYSYDAITEGLNTFLDYYDGTTLTSDFSDEAKEYFNNLVETSKNEVKISVNHVMDSNDDILAGSFASFGNAYLTLAFDDEIHPSEEVNDYLENYIALENIVVKNDTKTPEFKGIQTNLYEFMVKAENSCFVNAEPDKDGYLRRLFPVFKYNGKYYGQLVFVPLLKHFGNPVVEISNSAVVLKNAKISETEVKDIVIPRDEQGSIIIKYPPKDYEDYNLVGLNSVYRLAKYEAEFYSDMEYFKDIGFFYTWEGEDICELYRNIQFMRESLSKGEGAESGITDETYLEYVNLLYEETKKYFASNAFALLKDYIDEEDLEDYTTAYNEAKNNFTEIYNSRERVRNKVQNAMCIVGTNAQSTTDYGMNQYQERYPNPGVHYAFANQILSQDFVDDSPVWISIVIALVICLGYAYFSKKIKSTGKQIGVGIISVVVLSGVLLVIFLLTKKFVGFIVPVTALILSFVATSIAGFLSASHEKKFIQNAFSQCLSKEVVNDIVANPSSFKLGGQRLEMTAMFTDIQKFSGFSELLSASQLVALLNYYLTKMSDIIMDERGTVDKYEGDAIIALVGAPVKMDDHAQRACAAAIKMKKAEVLMNKEIAEIAAAEKPEDMDSDLYNAFKIMVQNKRVLFTRIGLNSGEMIAGYMGSENKKNYTMMGNNVNLASRLEGVNKQYSTGGIMISDATRQLLGDRFVVRSLDRVQVVNVNTPIRLYELIDEVSEADEKLIKYVDAWEKTLKIFEDGNYAKALELFKKLSEIDPNDKVCKYYISLLEKFFINGKYPTEQDDFGVAYNAENPSGMNPEWVGSKFEIKGTFRLLQK